MRRRTFLVSSLAMLFAAPVVAAATEEMPEAPREPKILLASPTEEDAERYLRKRLEHAMRYKMSPERFQMLSRGHFKSADMQRAISRYKQRR